MSRLRVDVLGAVRVRHGSATVCFPTRKAVALFVYLTVEAGPHARDKLAALFWPDSDRSHARSMLRYTLACLRQALQESADDSHLLIEREALGVNFASDVDLDVNGLTWASNACLEALAQLRQIAERCRGEFLECFSLPDAPDFDEWAGLQREFWRNRLEQLLDRISELEIQGGDSSEALATVQRWVAVNPVNEEAHRRLNAPALHGW
jgi:DNA-binding SARP family transcriptional activator